MNRVKIGSSYLRSGYGRTSERKANVYLIDGKAYARDKTTAQSQFNVPDGELSAYVMVNGCKNNKTGKVFFYQCSNHSEHDKHLPYTY